MEKVYKIGDLVLHLMRGEVFYIDNKKFRKVYLSKIY